MKNEGSLLRQRLVLALMITTITYTTIITTVKINNSNIAKENISADEIIEIAKINDDIDRGETTSRSSVDRSEDNQDVVDKEAETVEEEQTIEQESTVDVSNNKFMQYISIEDVEISVNMDITVTTGLSKEDFKTLIENCKCDTSGFFYENADLIYDLCQKYELNEIFFCGLISAESGWNIASNHRSTHNYISLMANGKLKSYSSVEEGLEVAAKTLHNDYLSVGGRFFYGKTLQAMKTRFCPASSTWVGLVYGRMEQLV